MRRLRDRRGETLTETLCAVLVLALAVALLGAMLSASFRLDRKVDQIAGELYQAFSGAEKPATGASGAQGSVSVRIGSDAPKDVPVEFYGNSDQVASYRVKPEGGTP